MRNNHLLLVICLGFLLLLSGCGAHVYHQVRKGETLGSIATRYGQPYRSLADWNDIDPPFVVVEGQWVRLSPPPASPWAQSKHFTPKVRPPTAKLMPKPLGPTPSPTPADEPVAVAQANWPDEIKWQWPTEGELGGRFNPQGRVNQGVDILGTLGQSIVAAASGQIVYCGSGLLGYGRLIIVKHNKNYLSAYAHNDQLLVKEGDWVEAGQEIAKMGRSGTDHAVLHFEIRRNGKPTDPLQYLGGR